MTKPTPEELREMQAEMTATRNLNQWTQHKKRYRLRRRTWPDARDNRISRCMSCGGWQWDHQCPARECWTNLENTTNHAA